MMQRETRRSFLRKTGYVAPAVLTLKAVPAFASNGSTRDHHDDNDDNDDNEDKDKNRDRDGWPH